MAQPYKKKIKIKRLKHLFKRALVDLKKKGKVDTGDKNLNVFINFFLKEDPKKIVLLVDNFLTLAKPMMKDQRRFSIDSDQASDSVDEPEKDSPLGKEEKDKLLSLKLQSIEEVIKRSEKIKRKRDALRRKKKKPAPSPKNKDRSFNNSILKRKFEFDTDQNRHQANKFFSRQNSSKKKLRLRSRKPSLFSTNEEEEDDMNLHKYLFAKTAKESSEITNPNEKPITPNVNMLHTNRKSLLDRRSKISSLKLKTELETERNLD